MANFPKSKSFKSWLKSAELAVKETVFNKSSQFYPGQPTVASQKRMITFWARIWSRTPPEIHRAVLPLKISAIDTKFPTLIQTFISSASSKTNFKISWTSGLNHPKEVSDLALIKLIVTTSPNKSWKCQSNRIRGVQRFQTGSSQWTAKHSVQSRRVNWKQEKRRDQSPAPFRVNRYEALIRMGRESAKFIRLYCIVTIWMKQVPPKIMWCSWTKNWYLTWIQHLTTTSLSQVHPKMP